MERNKEKRKQFVIFSFETQALVKKSDNEYYFNTRSEACRYLQALNPQLNKKNGQLSKAPYKIEPVWR
ncbi:hypothetical protein [Enterococcus avium]|uniref:hypothetical protein n=1 Tax=Enterococcus avium TaxID=33945 RepID=UPI00288EC48E|nr:hypothetical protein [Enterococcus avium]MDT2482603.1 hypothetical protein [Enterococcus avium]MDT2509299.1 hypothetical protein [Enterococcus avium]